MKSHYASRTAVLCLLAILYLVFIQKYRAYEIDNSWFLSFSYNSCHGNIQTDEFKNYKYPYGMDGVHLFGRLAAATQCGVLNTASWTVAAVVWLNTAFAIASLWLWWSFLELMGYRERWIAGFILLLGVTEAMLGMVEKARYEFFCFFLLSAALWLAVQSFEAIAALLAMVTVETEPKAIVIPIAVVLLLIMRTRNWKLLTLKLGLAAACAIGIYVGLHPGGIQEIIHTPYHARQPDYIHLGESPTESDMGAYFVKRKRHLPELAMLLLGSFLYWKNRRKILDRTSAWTSLLLAAIYLLPFHANVNYQIFAMPFFLWVAMEGYAHSREWLWVPAMVFVLILTQYGYLYYVNLHEGFTADDFSAVRSHIDSGATAIGISADQVNICGDFSLWHVHPQNYHDCNFDRDALSLQSLLQKSNIFLCFDEQLQTNVPSYPSNTCAELKRATPLRELSSLVIKGHVAHILSHP